MNLLKVGAGKVCINPPAELFPVGKIQEMTAEPGMDRLYVRAILLCSGETRFLFLSFDAGDAPGQKIKCQISERYNIPVDCILASGIHNHAFYWGRREKAVGIGKEPPAKLAWQDRYEKIVLSGMYQAIDLAFNSLQEAQYGYGTGKSYVNSNRERLFEDGHYMPDQNFGGVSDKTLSILKFEDLDGKLIAAVLNYSCHGVFSHDMPEADGVIRGNAGMAGAACHYLEQRYGDDAVFLWNCGAGADQNMLFAEEGFPRTYEADGYSETMRLPAGAQLLILKHFGQTHAVDAIRILNKTACSKRRMKIRTASANVILDGQKPPEGADMFLNMLMMNNTVRTVRPDLCIDGKPPEKKLVKMIPQGTVPLKMQLAVLGDVAFVGIAGELYTQIGLECKAASPMRNTVVVTSTDRGSAGYIVSDDAADHDTFKSFDCVHPGDNDGRIVRGMLTMFDVALNQV